jgi:hypothetical protein
VGVGEGDVADGVSLVVVVVVEVGAADVGLAVGSSPPAEQAASARTPSSATARERALNGDLPTVGAGLPG